MKTYTVHAKRWERGWELHIPDVGVTQSHGLADAKGMATSYITMMTDAVPDSFTVDIIPEIGRGLDEAATTAREAVRRAEEIQQRAAAQSRTVARQLHDHGLSGRDIAAVLRVSPQRVSQLLGGSDQPATTQPAAKRTAAKRTTASGLASLGSKQTAAASAAFKSSTRSAAAGKVVRDSRSSAAGKPSSAAAKRGTSRSRKSS
jgi:predicted transcriptional regulator